MSEWLDDTILPELLRIDPRNLSGKNFWYVADDVVSEDELRRKRDLLSLQEDPLVGMSGDTFNKIEMDLFTNIDTMMNLSPNAICYDTTNLYTYMEEPTRSQLAQTCNSKHCKHHLKHVGLLMAVERTHGIPLVSNVYQANRHDSKVFSCILADLVVSLKQMCGEQSDLVIGPG